MRKCSEKGTLEDSFECTEVTPDSPEEGDNADAGAGAETTDREDDTKDDKSKNDDDSKANDLGSAASPRTVNFARLHLPAWTQTDYVVCCYAV